MCHELMQHIVDCNGVGDVDAVLFLKSEEKAYSRFSSAGQVGMSMRDNN